jgi:aerobic-type carbon monoxide dehydrogenase small subunit (CoxS/CutS family)
MRSSTGAGSSDKSALPITGQVSRRAFIRGIGTTAVSAATLGTHTVAAELAAANTGQPRGPQATPVTLAINGGRETFSLEPRATLLEALRLNAGLTGPKEACDRGTCGACTVWLDGAPVYACMMLAIEAEGHTVTTIEGLSRSGSTPLQKAIVAADGLQCGFCTPGFVMSLSALQEKNPNPTPAEVRKACSGHLCRCGSYPRVFAAALAANQPA